MYGTVALPETSVVGVKSIVPPTPTAALPPVTVPMAVIVSRSPWSLERTATLIDWFTPVVALSSAAVGVTVRRTICVTVWPSESVAT